MIHTKVILLNKLTDDLGNRIPKFTKKIGEITRTFVNNIHISMIVLISLVCG